MQDMFATLSATGEVTDYAATVIEQIFFEFICLHFTSSVGIRLLFGTSSAGGE